jgi:hypothetical protein
VKGFSNLIKPVAKHVCELVFLKDMMSFTRV